MSPPVTCSGAAYCGVSTDAPSRVSAVRVARRLVRLVGLDQLGDAEVEQLHLAVARDEHVRRLQVAVDDQVRVRVRDGREHVEQQPQPRVDAQRSPIAIFVEALAVDVFQHEERLAGRRDARIDEMRDVRMREPREDAAFAPEARFARAADERRVQEFHRGAAFEAAVAAFREPDRAHAALADERHEPVRADDGAGHRERWRRDADASASDESRVRQVQRVPRIESALFDQALVFEKPRVVQARVPLEQRLHVGRQRGILGAQRREPRRALGGREIQRAIEIRARGEPAGAS